MRREVENEAWLEEDSSRSKFYYIIYRQIIVLFQFEMKDGKSEGPKGKNNIPNKDG